MYTELSEAINKIGELECELNEKNRLILEYKDLLESYQESFSQLKHLFDLKFNVHTEKNSTSIHLLNKNIFSKSTYANTNPFIYEDFLEQDNNHLIFN